MIQKLTNIKIGENIYKASFNFGVIKGIQNSIKGIKVDDIFKGVQEQNFEVIIELVYHAIKFNHKEFTRKQVESLGIADVEGVFNSIAELFDISLPAPKNEDDEEEKN